ncbi:type II secretion system protein [Rouxiella silvae]|uniref:Type II secretion system F family protein n=1 Tax=Rouxiella silvae TaxID=1646373 RepID=A0AA40X6L0_9GAMM|nr:type II secretion system F family protein [Rouxiella silvae]MBF6639621.1 type II secretion system F family protein [Rouxiella silvae]ORJ22734.1 type II secretion system protein [Rouxiella silvae]
MKTFDVTLLLNGKSSIQRIRGKSADEARINAAAGGALVIKVKACQQWKGGKKPFPLVLFTQELVALLEAGLVVVEAIEALHESCREEFQRQVLFSLLQELYQGCQLSQAMAAQAHIFPALLVSTVASSEQTGQLATALTRFQFYEKRIDILRKRIRSTLLYPCVVLSVGALIMFFLLGFIIPRFSVVFAGMKNPSSSAQFIVWWGKLVTQHGMLLLVATLISTVALVVLLRSKAMKTVMMNVLMRIPQLRSQFELSVLIRFYRTLGLLLQGGMPAVDALEMTGTLLPASYWPRLKGVLNEVREGKAISQTLNNYQLTTPVAARLLAVGERGGELPAMCERIAAFYDESLERAIETFSKVFEPVLMLLVGGMVGMVVFLLYMPIFEMAGSLS